MNRTNILTAILTAACILGLAAAFGLAQPDGIDPPAGPVMDTQPSLTSIDSKLDKIALIANDFPPNLQMVVAPPVFENSETVLQNVDGTVRIYSVLINNGSAGVTDANGLLFASITGSAYSPGDLFHRGSSQQFFGGLEVATPLTVSSFGINTTASVRILYWIEE